MTKIQQVRRVPIEKLGRRQAPKAGPSLDERRAKRLAQAQANLAAWERRAKIAQRRVAKYRTKVRNMERYHAKAAQVAPHIEEQS